MSHCLVCTQPENPDVTFCQSCGTKLLLRERYRAVRQIGQGGFGKTFLAVDQDLPNKPACAIKQFSPQIQGASGLQKATELFEQEAVQLNILGKHPQIPELLAHFEQDGRLYLVQEYVKGQNLAEELAQDGAFSEAKIRELLVGLLPVLQYIHDNQVIHRDIKPENIIRRDDGKLFLVDFGAVKLMAGSVLLGAGTVIGDPRYMPSEQVRGRVSFASDLYSLGVTSIHLLTSCEPDLLFSDYDDQWIWRQFLNGKVFSNHLGQILDRMLEKALSRRFQNVTDALIYLNSPLKTDYDPLSVSSLTLVRLQTDQPIVQTKPNIPVLLKSARGIDYSELEQLLKAQQWRKADELTGELIHKVVDRVNGSLSQNSIVNFPCQDLQIIDQLWVHYSISKFGFSVQRRLWLSCGGSDNTYEFKTFHKFAAKIGWYHPDKDKWRTYNEFMNDTENGQNALPSSLPFQVERRQEIPMGDSKVKCSIKQVILLLSHGDL